MKAASQQQANALTPEKDKEELRVNPLKIEFVPPQPLSSRENPSEVASNRRNASSLHGIEEATEEKKRVRYNYDNVQVEEEIAMKTGEVKDDIKYVEELTSKIKLTEQQIGMVSCGNK